MPGQPKYCPECKGYGQLYQQTITRYGDTRIKEQTRQNALDCEECKGTGLITLQTTKIPQFKPEDIMSPINEQVKPITDEEKSVNEKTEAMREDKLEFEKDDKLAEDKRDAVKKLIESVDSVEKSEDDMEFEPKYNEPSEGDMPL